MGLGHHKEHEGQDPAGLRHGPGVVSSREARNSCFGLNCAPQKICWTPNSWSLRTGLHLEIGSFEINRRRGKNAEWGEVETGVMSLPTKEQQGCWQTLEAKKKARSRVSVDLQRERGPANTGFPASSLQNCDTVSFCHFKPSQSKMVRCGRSGKWMCLSASCLCFPLTISVCLLSSCKLKVSAF